MVKIFFENLKVRLFLNTLQKTSKNIFWHFDINYPSISITQYYLKLEEYNYQLVAFCFNFRSYIAICVPLITIKLFFVLLYKCFNHYDFSKIRRSRQCSVYLTTWRPSNKQGYIPYPYWSIIYLAIYKFKIFLRFSNCS